MKKILIVLSVVAFTFPVLAQETNISRVAKEACPEFRKKGRSEGKQVEFEERRLKMMETTLREIGVSEEEKVQILALQQQQRDAMKANSKRVHEAHRKLSELQNSGASEVEVDAAIDAVTSAQAEQLKILARNRRKMEEILGKEKSDLLMEKARKQYRKHGRRGGEGIPRRPEGPEGTGGPVE
ncbi:MAG TPA: hypothetical protein VIR63_06400 [Pontiella sp.]